MVEWSGRVNGSIVCFSRMGDRYCHLVKVSLSVAYVDKSSDECGETYQCLPHNHRWTSWSETWRSELKGKIGRIKTGRKITIFCQSPCEECLEENSLFAISCSSYLWTCQLKNSVQPTDLYFTSIAGIFLLSGTFFIYLFIFWFRRPSRWTGWLSKLVQSQNWENNWPFPRR